MKHCNEIGSFGCGEATGLLAIRKILVSTAVSAVLSSVSASSHISVRHEARERCPRISMTKWLVAENFLASTPCAFAVFSMSQRGIR